MIYTIITSMANMFDYLSWRGDLDFKAAPFNSVDNIILSQLSYFTLDGIVPSPEDKESVSIALAVRLFNEKSKEPGFKLTSQFKEDPDLIRALGASVRFGTCELFGFVNHVDTALEVQFSAFCISTNDNHCFVVFRGTDSSLVGWKEDFNMCFMDVIPSQILAVEYLEKMAPMIKGNLRIGGHSKGGNLAIYASSHCGRKIQKRIKTVYSNDAPGFSMNEIQKPGFIAIKEKIKSYVPQSSIIGMLMENGWKNNVIQSNGTGLMQHCLYLWEVSHNELSYADKITSGSRFISKIIHDWLYSHDNSQREYFIEALYHIINAADVKSTADFEHSWFSAAGRVLKSLNGVDESTKKIIRQTIMELFRAAGKNFDTFLH